MLYISRRADAYNGNEEAIVDQILDEMAHEINASVGVKMHRLGVFEWEVKLWISSTGDANGAWRVVVVNVTGHTCIVNVSGITYNIQITICLYLEKEPY